MSRVFGGEEANHDIDAKDAKLVRRVVDAINRIKLSGEIPVSRKVHCVSGTIDNLHIVTCYLIEACFEDTRSVSYEEFERVKRINPHRIKEITAQLDNDQDHETTTMIFRAKVSSRFFEMTTVTPDSITSSPRVDTDGDDDEDNNTEETRSRKRRASSSSSSLL